MADTPIRTRFAPSPTGYLHVGGARTALFNWLFARHHGGSFVLRVEDTDNARNTEEARTAIFGGLKWLGLDWDEGPDVGGDFGPYQQSERKDIYDRWFAKLEETGAIYDDNGAARFRSPEKTIALDDAICGNVEIDLSDEPDMTLRRPDGSYIFHFVNVIDDIEMKISHVIRGEDHLSNTPKHIQIYRALGADPPQFAHIPLILNPDGSKMSKRDQGAAIGAYKDEGYLPEAVVNYLSLLGWSPKDDREILSLNEIVSLFDLANVNRSNARFDLEKCAWLSGQYLGALDDDAFVTASKPFAPDAPESLLPFLKPKVRKLSELPGYLESVLDPNFPLSPDVAAKVAANPDNATYLTTLATNFKQTEWEEASIKATIAATAEEHGVKQGKLMFPLRIALTGTGQGTDLMASMIVIGQQGTIDRITQRMPLIFAAPAPQSS